MSPFSLRRKAADQPATTSHCFVLAQRTAPPTDRSLASTLKKRLGGACTIRESKDTVWMLRLKGTDNAFLSFTPAAIPTGEAEAAADNMLWPNGNEFAAHKAHIVAAVTPSDRRPVTGAILLSHLASAALEAFEGTAVYWGSGAVTVPRKMFMDMASTAAPDHLPLALWTRFQLFAPFPDQIGLYTVGLSQFGLMELEVDACHWGSGALLEFCFDLAHYLVVSGPVIEDGNTVGGTESERIRVRHAKSSRAPSQLAYKIEIPPGSTGPGA